MLKDKTQRIHLIGIAGSGLSAIARVLLESGYTVSGSDRQASAQIPALEAAGARIFTGHNAENVTGAGLVIRSSAVSDDNTEVKAALAAGIPVFKRADFLGSLMSGRRGIAVAGTHGKTTTTAMIAWILVSLGQAPSFIAGSSVKGLDTNAQAGSGPDFVIEADEYDGMFLGLNPDISVVTNLEHDHPDCYPTPDDYYQAFLSFVMRLKPGGLLFTCADDPGAARLKAQIDDLGLNTRSYGLAPSSSDYQAANLRKNNRGGLTFEFAYQDSPPVQVDLQIPGTHNVSNAAAALAVAHHLDLPLQASAQALANFQGTGRRFDVISEAGQITVIDDYAHHPAEIRATLAAARTRYAGRRLWVVWQPHTYSRTRALLSDFNSAFEDADQVLVTEIYASRENPPQDGFSGAQVAASLRHPSVHYTPHLAQAADLLLDHLQSGDVLLVLSAGDADQVSAQVSEKLSKRSKEDAR
jgi:UDP-N-acetylmuramate--alanine ligase